jgi:hypothetical protein
VLGNCGWSHAAGDVSGVHDHAGSGDLIRHRYADRAAVQRTFAELKPQHRYAPRTF